MTGIGKNIFIKCVLCTEKEERQSCFGIRSFSNRIEVIGEDSGLHILLKVHNGMEEKELMEAAAERSIKVYPASIYYKEETFPKVQYCLDLRLY